MARTQVEPYHYAPATCQEFDPKASEVAARVARLVRVRCPKVTIEHVGSTAIPGCGGKGVVDLMAVYPDGMLAEARDAIDSLGFQHQTFGDPFPEERPMRVGSMRLSGTSYRIHIHVIAESSWEVDALRRFRDRLREDNRLVRAYVKRKRDLIQQGVRESPDYARAKGGFIASVLQQERSSA